MTDTNLTDLRFHDKVWDQLWRISALADCLSAANIDELAPGSAKNTAEQIFQLAGSAEAALSDWWESR